MTSVWFLPSALVDVTPYSIYYRVVGNGVVVVALFHAARDPDLPGLRLQT